MRIDTAGEQRTPKEREGRASGERECACVRTRARTMASIERNEGGLRYK